MRFGFHIGISGGLVKAAEYALESGCDCLQIFSSNPTAWRPTRFDEKGAAYVAETSGPLYARSDWSATAVWMSLAAGEIFMDHQHYDQGHITIVRGTEERSVEIDLSVSD